MKKRDLFLEAIHGRSTPRPGIGSATSIATTDLMDKVGAAFPAARLVGKSLEMYFPVFIVTKATIVMALGASLAVGFLAALIPVYRAVTIRIADGLRGID